MSGQQPETIFLYAAANAPYKDFGIFRLDNVPEIAVIEFQIILLKS